MMGKALSPLFCLLVQLFCFVLPTQATQWTIRSYAVLSSYVTTGYITSNTFTYSTTIYLTSPSPTPTATPYSSRTYVATGSNVTYITYYLPPGAVPQAVLASATSTRNYEDITLTYFYMPVEYTAPASCPTPFTYTSSTYVNVPDGAESQVTPTSATTTVRQGTDTVVSAYLTPSAVPLETPPSTTDFIYEEYVASCTNPATTSDYSYHYSYPTASSYYGGYHSGGDDYDSYYDDNCIGHLCPFWLIYIIIFCTVPPLLFILGLFESYFWFSRLMKGRFAFRGVPLFWVCISLWTLCCLRRSKDARPEQQAALEKQWREMSTGRRLGLWFSYGFRHRNPPEIDAVLANSQQQMTGYAPGGLPPYMPPGQQPYYPPPGQQPYQPHGPQLYYPPPGQGGPAPNAQYAPVQQHPGSPLQRAGYPPPNQPGDLVPCVQQPHSPHSPASSQQQPYVSPVQQLYVQQEQRPFSPASSSPHQPQSSQFSEAPERQSRDISSLEVAPQQKPQDTPSDSRQPVTSVQEVAAPPESHEDFTPHAR